MSLPPILLAHQQRYKSILLEEHNLFLFIMARGSFLLIWLKDHKRQQSVDQKIRLVSRLNYYTMQAGSNRQKITSSQINDISSNLVSGKSLGVLNPTILHIISKPHTAWYHRSQTFIPHSLVSWRVYNLSAKRAWFK